jgi:hypothetical protein
MPNSFPKSGWEHWATDGRNQSPKQVAAGTMRARSDFGLWLCLAAAILGQAIEPCRRAWAQEWFEDWQLESGVAHAHLVMVARVASISQLTVVEGAKTDVRLREYRFQPVQRLKGIFQREQLSMTASDLGCPPEDAEMAPPLREGEFRLLILAQQRGGFLGCVSAAPGATTFEQRVPLLTAPDDPIVGVVETLIQVADSRSRRERAQLLIERLAGAEGAPAVLILQSLRMRAEWAAADERVYQALVRLVRDRSTAVRSAALAALREVLATRVSPENPQQLEGVADVLRDLLDSDEEVDQVRLAVLEAVGHLLALQPRVEWAVDVLREQLTAAPTYAQRAAAASALAHVKSPQAADAVLEALVRLPLDELPAREAIYAQAAVSLDQPRAERALVVRVERSIAARQSLQAEIQQLGRLRTMSSLPLLLNAAAHPALAAIDRQTIAWALGRLGDDRAVDVLVGWMRGQDYQLKELALTALESLDSAAAAQEVRPLLKSEAYLPYKLRMARMLARHQMADGYALATEHLADVEHTAWASLVLAALGDPRTPRDLSGIVAARPDRRWHAAALAGLVAVGDAAARQQLDAILADDRHPLVADAAAAAGLAPDVELLPRLAALVPSRNRQIAMASLAALRQFFSGVRTSPRGLAAVRLDEDDPLPPEGDIPKETRVAIETAVSALLLDTYVDAELRQEALAVSRLMRDEHYFEVLAELADQAELEGTPLLAAAEAELRRARLAP